jgi:hypothetical protein
MQAHVANWFVLDTATSSGTDWVVTMPTKPFYSLTVNGRVGRARPPFTTNFWTGGAPDFFGAYPAAGFHELHCPPDRRTMVYDREGKRPPRQICIGIPPTSPELHLSWTANVLTFQSSSTMTTTLIPDSVLGVRCEYGVSSQHFNCWTSRFPEWMGQDWHRGSSPSLSESAHKAGLDRLSTGDLLRVADDRLHGEQFREWNLACRK